MKKLYLLLVMSVCLGGCVATISPASHTRATYIIPVEKRVHHPPVRYVQAPPARPHPRPGRRPHKTVVMYPTRPIHFR